MRLLPLAPILLACASRQPPLPPEGQWVLYGAGLAEQAADWPRAREELEEEALLHPKDAAVALRLAEVILHAYGEEPEARLRYGRLLKTARAQALHGLGACALHRGDDDQARRLWNQSLAEAQTPACARDLAVLELSEGNPARAQEALEIVVKISVESVETRLLLVAARMQPPTRRLPAGWYFALPRARIHAVSGRPVAAARDLREYLRDGFATESAREAARRRLAEDFALKGNPGLRTGIK